MLTFWVTVESRQCFLILLPSHGCVGSRINQVCAIPCLCVTNRTERAQEGASVAHWPEWRASQCLHVGQFVLYWWPCAWLSNKAWMWFRRVSLELMWSDQQTEHRAAELIVSRGQFPLYACIWQSLILIYIHWQKKVEQPGRVMETKWNCMYKKVKWLDGSHWNGWSKVVGSMRSQLVQSQLGNRPIQLMYVGPLLC